MSTSAQGRATPLHDVLAPPAPPLPAQHAEGARPAQHAEGGRPAQHQQLRPVQHAARRRQRQVLRIVCYRQSTSSR